MRTKSHEQIDKPEPLIVVYGPLVTPTGSKVSARNVLETLFQRHIWFFSRRLHALIPGTPLLFYEKGLGFTATAEVAGADEFGGFDITLLTYWGIRSYKTKIVIRNTAHLSAAIAIAPLVHTLDFISNKSRWGVYFQVSPRRIPQRDYDRILKEITSRDLYRARPS